MDTSQKKYILVAEDNTLIGKVLTNKLTQAGYEVQLVINGDEALQAVAKRKPDLLVLDLIMPIKDGFATLKELRANPAISDTKVVVNSDLRQNEDLQKLQALGVLQAFDKANLQEIVNTVPKFF